MSQTDKIRQILKEGTDIDTIKRIAVFDFDGTLVDTPTPERGKVEYRRATGESWPHKGWWGRSETLDMDIFKMPLISSVISDYESERETADTLVVMLTGRIQRLSHEVELILATYGLRFDGYYYNNGGSTLDFKIGVLNRLLKEHPNVQSVELWDDREPHVISFRVFGDVLVKSGKLQSFNVTQVYGNHHI